MTIAFPASESWPLCVLKKIDSNKRNIRDLITDIYFLFESVIVAFHRCSYENTLCTLVD